MYFQDIALMELFTVSEMFHYFGRVSGLSAAEITKKGEELLQLMELPAPSYLHRIIGTLRQITYQIRTELLYTVYLRSSYGP